MKKKELKEKLINNEINIEIIKYLYNISKVEKKREKIEEVLNENIDLNDKIKYLNKILNLKPSKLYYNLLVDLNIELKNLIEIGDIIIEPDDNFRIGFGIGKISLIGIDYLNVKFENKKLEVVINKKLFVYDKETIEGKIIKGRKHSYFLEEIKRKKKFKKIKNLTISNKNLLEYLENRNLI